MGPASAGGLNGLHHRGESSVAERMERVRSALRYIDPHDHDTWVKVGMGLQSEFGDDGWDLWDEWSCLADNYDAKANRARWRSLKANGGVTIHSVFYLAREGGWRADYWQQSHIEIANFRPRQKPGVEKSAAVTKEIAASEAAKKATTILTLAAVATSSNTYCQRKSVEPSETLREIDIGRAETLLGYAPRFKGERLKGSCLVVPIERDGRLTSLQLIDGEGRKHFLAAGIVGGCYWTAKPLPEYDHPGLHFLIAEGVATALSALEAEPEAMAIAGLSSGNLPVVTRGLRLSYPQADIVIIADIHKNTGEPDRHAVEAAMANEARLAVPRFDDGPAPDRKDLNDLARAHGTEALRRAIELAEVPIGASDWPQPQLLVSTIQPEPYPVDALPDAIRKAIDDVANYVQAPIPLIASSALSALSLTCQHLIDVRRDEQLCGPVSLNFLTLGESGERKTKVDSEFMAPLRKWQMERAEDLKPAVEIHKAKYSAWSAECEGVRNAIKDAVRKERPTDNLKDRLSMLTTSEPRAPRVPFLFLGDETSENLAWRLNSQWPSAGLISAEAGVVFGGHAMSADNVLRYLALLNVLWDGGEHSVGRKTSQSFTLKGARLTCGLLVQEAALLDFIKRAGLLARGTGFWARFLIARPVSTQGTRSYREPGPMPYLKCYQERLKQLLAQSMPLREDGSVNPTTAYLGRDAKLTFIAFHDAVEAELKEGGELRDVRDVASKAAENASRLAALFEAFANDPTLSGLQVSADAFVQASRIVAWHLSEARRFFGELALPKALADAARLDGWLIAHCNGEHKTSVHKNHVKQYGPGRLRDSRQLETALMTLQDLDRIRIKAGRPVLIELNPLLLSEVS
jgi:putative DNA primase/helicase